MTKGLFKKTSLSNNHHHQCVVDTLLYLYAKGLPSNEQPDLVYFPEDDTWGFENLTPLSEKVFFKIVGDCLDEVPTKQNRFTRTVSEVTIQNLADLIDEDFLGNWTIYISPDTDGGKLCFDFDDHAEATKACLTI